MIYHMRSGMELSRQFIPFLPLVLLTWPIFKAPAVQVVIFQDNHVPVLKFPPVTHDLQRLSRDETLWVNTDEPVLMVIPMSLRWL